MMKTQRIFGTTTTNLTRRHSCAAVKKTTNSIPHIVQNRRVHKDLKDAHVPGVRGRGVFVDQISSYDQWWPFLVLSHTRIWHSSSNRASCPECLAVEW